MTENILKDISEAIGNTPLVRLNRVPAENGIKCEIIMKCEYLNPGGSVKDRIGKKMFEEAVESGKLKPGDTIMEATSGNTGVGLALMASAKGYPCCIVMPQKMSSEKVNVLKGLGAEIVRTRTEARFFEKDSHIETCKRLERERAPNAMIMDQYNNDMNWKAHYDHTGQEIVDAVNGKCDYLVIGTGTGGTMTGVAKKVREHIPGVQTVGVDPHGSIMADPENPEEELKKPSNYVEGIGYDFVPYNCMREYVDHWVKTGDNESFHFARRLLHCEGLLVGGTSGANLAGCFDFIKSNNLQDREDLRFIVFAPDNLRNYMTKHLSDEWLVSHGFKEHDVFYDPSHPFAGMRASKCKDLKQIPHYDDRLTVGDALDCFKNGDKIIPLIECGTVKGILTEDTLLQSIVSKKLSILSSASKAITKEFTKLPYETDLSIVHHLLSKTPAVLLEKKGPSKGDNKLYAITLDDIVKLFRNQMKEQLLINF